MKKFWLFCLYLTSLSLVGCFHIPDEDWLPSKNKINTWDTQENEEIENAINEFMNWINIISSDWNDLKNEENSEITTEKAKDLEMEDKTVNEEEIIDDEITNEED